jgi:periplasmic divalent cation tolerance protein
MRVATEREVARSVLVEYCSARRKQNCGEVGAVTERATRAIVVLVTCASAREAEKIARSLVAKRLAACGNIVGPPVTSIYRWKDKVERAREILLVLKSTRARFAVLEREVRRLHSYEVPEIIALPIPAGSREYLSWLAENTRPAKKLRG